MAKNFVAEIVADRTRRNPEFRRLLKEAEDRLALARKLAPMREKRQLSQTVVAEGA
jgi:hypothetical protein